MDNINNKMSIDEHGTVAFDFTGGFDEKDLFNVLTVANQKAAEHYRKNDPLAAFRRADQANGQYRDAVNRNWERAGDLRRHAKAKIVLAQYASAPGAIVHRDGVIELPVY